ncbi:MAG: hypothetical protein ACYC6N_12505 [Pirellulaceae bacterium]
MPSVEQLEALVQRRLNGRVRDLRHELPSLSPALMTRAMLLATRHVPWPHIAVVRACRI